MIVEWTNWFLHTTHVYSGKETIRDVTTRDDGSCVGTKLVTFALEMHIIYVGF